MRHILLALLASCTMAATLPTSAIAEHRERARGGVPGEEYPSETYPNEEGQDRGQRGRGGQYRCNDRAYDRIQGELQRLYERVREGQYDGSYSRDSARNFYRAIGLTRQYLDSYLNNDGCLDRREVSEVRWRIDAIRQQMDRYDRRPGGRRGRY
jgi:hypothetical protein